MIANVGSLDRKVRIVAGLGILAAGFYFRSYWGLIGIVPLFTASVRWCPLYSPLKLSTIKKIPQEK